LLPKPVRPFVPNGIDKPMWIAPRKTTGKQYVVKARAYLRKRLAVAAQARRPLFSADLFHRLDLKVSLGQQLL